MLNHCADCSLCVDNFQICCRSSNMSSTVRQLQLCPNKLHQGQLKRISVSHCQKCLFAYLPEKYCLLFLDKSSNQVCYPLCNPTKLLDVQSYLCSMLPRLSPTHDAMLDKKHIILFGNIGNILFNDALNTFYLRLYGIRNMASDSERENTLPPHELLFPISSMSSFICTIPQTE